MCWMENSTWSCRLPAEMGERRKSWPWPCPTSVNSELGPVRSEPELALRWGFTTAHVSESGVVSSRQATDASQLFGLILELRRQPDSIGRRPIQGYRLKAGARALSQATTLYLQFRIVPVSGYPGAASRHPDLTSSGRTPCASLDGFEPHGHQKRGGQNRAVVSRMAHRLNLRPSAP